MNIIEFLEILSYKKNYLYILKVYKSLDFNFLMKIYFRIFIIPLKILSHKLIIYMVIY
jgi:hypothetical protein